MGLESKREARQQYAGRPAEKYGRMADYSLDEENREKYQKKFGGGYIKGGEQMPACQI